MIFTSKKPNILAVHRIIEILHTFGVIRCSPSACPPSSGACVPLRFALLLLPSSRGASLGSLALPPPHLAPLYAVFSFYAFTLHLATLYATLKAVVHKRPTNAPHSFHFVAFALVVRRNLKRQKSRRRLLAFFFVCMLALCFRSHQND